MRLHKETSIVPGLPSEFFSLREQTRDGCAVRRVEEDRGRSSGAGGDPGGDPEGVPEGPDAVAATETDSTCLQ